MNRRMLLLALLVAARLGSGAEEAVEAARPDPPGGTGGRDAAELWCVIQGGLTGFVAADGRLLAAPRYARCGHWNEERVWVQEGADAGSPGTFLDRQARPVAPAVYRDLSAVRPEQPLPAFAGGVAVVGLPDAGFGYLDAKGRLLGRTTSVGAFQRQDDPLLLCTSSGRIGFVDRRGNPAIPARFAEATPFRGGRAAARETTHWGLIDETGQWLSEPACDAMRWFADEPRFWAYRQNGRWGVLDHLGQRVTDASFDNLGTWHGERLGVERGGLWGLIGVDGSMCLEPRFAAVTPLEKSANAWAVCSENGLWGVADAEGHLVLPCHYEAISAPVPDLWLGRMDGRWGVLNATNGAWRVPPRYSRILGLPASFGERLLVERGQRWGIIDAVNGREILATRYPRIEPWLAWIAAEDAGAVRLFDVSGHPGPFWKGDLEGLPPPERMIDGLGILRGADGSRLVAATGEAVWSDVVEEAGEWNGGWLAVRRMGRWGFADRRGTLVIEPRFEAARSFVGEIAPVCEKGRWGLIGRTGDYCVEPVYEAMGVPWNSLVPVAREGRWGLISEQGREVLPCIYDGLEWGYDATGNPVWN